MGATGFTMWNPITTARFLPGEFIPAAKAAHGGEAVLAVLAIIVWHMYGVHLKRFNKSMFTGKMSEADMLHEHPLELADIKAGVADRPVDPVDIQKRQRIYLPIAAVLTLFMLGGIYGFVGAETTALTTTERQIPTVVAFVPQTLTPAPTQTPTALPTNTATPLPTATATVATTATETTPGTEATSAAPVSALTWTDTIGPMLQEKCGVCHGSAASGGLDISTYASAMEGGVSGAGFVPGDSAASNIVIKQQEGGHLGQLSPEELQQLIDWINAGAPEN
jgi:hypothetical protein